MGELLAVTGSGLQWLDWVVIAAYLAVVLGLGWFYSREKSDRRDYFIASRRPLPPA